LCPLFRINRIGAFSYQLNLPPFDFYFDLYQKDLAAANQLHALKLKQIKTEQDAANKKPDSGTDSAGNPVASGDGSGAGGLAGAVRRVRRKPQ
jgi:hypothetical protein